MTVGARGYGFGWVHVFLTHEFLNSQRRAESTPFRFLGQGAIFLKPGSTMRRRGEERPAQSYS